MFHETIAGGVVINNRNIRFLVAVENCDINFHQSFIFPQRGWISRI